MAVRKFACERLLLCQGEKGVMVGDFTLGIQAKGIVAVQYVAVRRFGRPGEMPRTTRTGIARQCKDCVRQNLVQELSVPGSECCGAGNRTG